MSSPGPSGPAATAAAAGSAGAQIRAGAAIARLMQGSLDGAAEEVTPVLALSREFRIATVTGWVDDLGHRLASPRYAASPLAIDLRQQIRQFRSEAPRPDHAGETR